MKIGIRLHGVEACDKIWLTACVLHNLLLEVDGLNDYWDNGVSSDWEGELGGFEESDQPFACQRLQYPSRERTGGGYDAPGSSDEEEDASSDEENDAPLSSGEDDAPGSNGEDDAPGSSGGDDARH